MGGRLNFTLEQAAEFDLALIPEAEADTLEETLDDDESEAFEVEELEAETSEQAPKPD